MTLPLDTRTNYVKPHARTLLLHLQVEPGLPGQLGMISVYVSLGQKRLIFGRITSVRSPLVVGLAKPKLVTGYSFSSSPSRDNLQDKRHQKLT